MDPTTVTLVGALVAFAGVIATAVVAYVGKRGELSLNGLNSLTDQLQEELVAKKEDLADKNAALAAEAAARASAEAENARLRAVIIQLGGNPG